MREAGDAPRTQAESDFCEIFGELLHLDHMTATENFFDLGGTSLLVTQVIIEAGKRGYSIVYADVFAHPTPRALAMLFEKDAKPEPEKADEDIEGYDYSAIHQLLAENTLDHFRDGAPVPLGDLLEFTPIDYAAKATVMLSQTPEKCVLFHVLSEQYIRQDHLFRTMQAMGHPIDYVERSDFEKALSDAQNDPRKAELLTSLTAYNYGEGDRKRQIIPFLREHTLQVLYRLGFSWPTISMSYFSRFIDHLNGMGYFDDSTGE